MELKFKKGDQVVCQDAGGMTSMLTDGKSYEVMDTSHHGTIKLVDDRYHTDYFLASRFSLWRRKVRPKNRSRVDAGPSWGIR